MSGNDQHSHSPNCSCRSLPRVVPHGTDSAAPLGNANGCDRMTRTEKRLRELFDEFWSNPEAEFLSARFDMMLHYARKEGCSLAYAEIVHEHRRKR